MSAAGAAPSARGGESVFVRSEGLRLHARIRGHGPPLLLLHGFTGSCAGMEGVAGRLSDTFRTVSLDLVGHGGSDAPRDPAAYRMERCVAQVVGALDALGIASAHLLGYSMGGRAALALCAWRPARVRSAVLVGASPGLERPGDAAERRARDEALADRIEREGLERFVDHWMALPLFATQERLGAAALARARAQRLANRPHGLALSLRGMGSGAQPPLHERLARLRVPLLLVAGAQDARFAAIARDVAGRAPDARVHLVANAGHACHLEEPEAFTHHTRLFFNEMEARSSDTPVPHAGASETTP